MIAARQTLHGGGRKPYDAEVEYLESTGTQWIDTGIIPDQDLAIETEFETLDTENSAYVYGARIGNLAVCIATSTVGGGLGYARWGNDRYDKCIGSANHVEQSASSIIVDGQSFPYRWNTNDDISSLNLSLYLFNANTSSPLPFRGKISYFKLYKNKLILDLIPVRKGNVGYMYDRVSGKLFGNSGAGNFILGADKKPVDTTVSAKSYIQDGLIAMYDGVENAGWGKHDANATTWKDLVGGNDFEATAILNEWTKDSAVFKGGCGKSQPWNLTNVLTLDVVGKSEQTSFFAFALDGSRHRMFCILPTNNRGFQFANNAPSMFRDWYSKRWSVTATWSAIGATSQNAQFYNGEYAGINSGTSSWLVQDSAILGYTKAEYAYLGEICCIRAYNRALTAEEIAHNYAVDKERFGL